MRFNRFREKIIIVVVIVVSGLLVVGCSMENLDFSQNKEDKITVLGELSPEGKNTLSLYYAAKLLTGELERPIENADVELVDLKSKEKVSYKYTKNGIWEMDWRDNSWVSGRSYQLNIDDGKIQASSVVQMPYALEAHVKSIKKFEDYYSISVLIKNPHPHACYCLVRMLGRAFHIENSVEKVYATNYQSVPVSSQDKFIANNIFNEIRSPYKMLFLDIPADQERLVTFKSYLSLVYNTDFYLWIKSLDKTYYKFRYRSVVQSENVIDGVMNVMPLHSNIDQGVGFFGACRTKEINIDLP
ncbi:DUF4249 domain-containing protein [Halosquirtibacter xylanolyticus]|uniref:DUF4249 family protein n=1 Tax=Halosquirtibacter xylanolyticus TaxID=3374599 RepID=UPI0037492488|nr:DUF4249 domain-containing protein [Prolixibacteraceae bacterium]